MVFVGIQADWGRRVINIRRGCSADIFSFLFRISLGVVCPIVYMGGFFVISVF